MIPGRKRTYDNLSQKNSSSTLKPRIRDCHEVASPLVHIFRKNLILDFHLEKAISDVSLDRSIYGQINGKMFN